ncbi:MAG: hypothetical protein ACLR4Z_10560 [Butyricicoccaceae bacterium]
MRSPACASTSPAFSPPASTLSRPPHFSAAGQASRGFIISLVRSIIAIPPVLFALSALLGVTGVWLTFPAVEALACVLSLLFILRSPK